MPAPPQNRNAIKHGVHGYLAIGSLPKGASYVRRLAGDLERGLRAAVQAKHGEITLYNAAVCQTAVRHEARAQLLTRWLRKADDGGNKIALMDRVAIMREIGAASDARDRCLRALGLDRADTQTAIDVLYADVPDVPAATDDPDDTPPSPPSAPRNGNGAAAIAPVRERPLRAKSRGHNAEDDDDDT